MGITRLLSRIQHRTFELVKLETAPISDRSETQDMIVRSVTRKYCSVENESTTRKNDSYYYYYYLIRLSSIYRIARLIAPSFTIMSNLEYTFVYQSLQCAR